MENSEETSLDLNLKLLAKSSMIVFIGVFLSKILGYVYRIIIARYYGPEVYGLFSLATMVLGWTIVVCSLGLVDGLSRFVPQYLGKGGNEKVSYLFNLTIKILLVSSILSSILLFSLSEFISINIFHSQELSLFLKILSIFILPTVLSGAFLLTLKGYEYIQIYSFIYNILQNIVKVLVLILFVLIGFNSSATILSFCIGLFIVFLAAYYVCIKKIPELFIKSELPKEEKLEIRKSFFSYSFPLLFFGVISMIFYWTDSFFLGYFRGTSSVGFYNAAVPIALLLGVIPELFMQLFFPLINRHYSNKKFELIKQLSKQIGKWIFIVNFPIFILILIFPGAIINILFGGQYLVVGLSLRILLLGSFISSLAVISNNLLSMAGKSKIVLIDITFALFVNIILNIIFIPMPEIFGFENSFGMVGAATATTISMIILNSLFFIQAKFYLNILPLRRKMVYIFFGGIISLFGLAFIRSIYNSSNLFLILILIGLFLLCYFCLILLFQTLDQNDLNVLFAIWNKLTRSSK